ncbi:hypothetical protein FQA47_015420 [Oryzias melastigma]|uniref:Uncharacterized protein n=1 Tax=Oryzias melastigma TaxID=30732 RepID=A0A834BQY3_ORYME|nr:hypothetical protein FQA47_015420 [Oryzias melastigma]
MRVTSSSSSSSSSSFLCCSGLLWVLEMDYQSPILLLIFSRTPPPHPSVRPRGSHPPAVSGLRVLLAFPGRGLCSSFCTVSRSSVFTACSSSWSFPIFRSEQRHSRSILRRDGASAQPLRAQGASAAASRLPPPPPGCLAERKTSTRSGI